MAASPPLSTPFCLFVFLSFSKKRADFKYTNTYFVYAPSYVFGSLKGEQNYDGKEEIGAALKLAPAPPPKKTNKTTVLSLNVKD